MKELKDVSYNLSVLYVEDNLIMSNYFTKFLKRSFKKVAAVNSGEEALQIYNEESFDLIITDVSMPTMDGLTLIDEIRRIDESQAIVVFSVCDNNATLVSLINNGVCGFITKPTDIGEANETLSRVCRQIQSKRILQYYHEELEKLMQEVLAVDCNPGCPMHNILHKSAKIEEPQAKIKDPEATKDEKPQPKPVLKADIQPLKLDNESEYKDYFSFLQTDDREELRDQLTDIDLSLISAFDGYKDVNPEYITRLGNSFIRFGSVLTHYIFFCNLGVAILELGKVIADQSEKIATEANDSKLYIGGFCSVLQTFMSEVWEKDSNNPKFFNDSIINDAHIIIDMIMPPKVDEDDHSLVFF